jgi:hypothetical protein
MIDTTTRATPFADLFALTGDNSTLGAACVAAIRTGTETEY